MTEPRLLHGAYVEGDLVVYGEQAYNFDEWMVYLRKRKTDGAPRPKPIETWGLPPTAEERRAELREYKREWMRRSRGTPRQPTGSLHSLACKGPTRGRGCACTKIKCYPR